MTIILNYEDLYNNMLSKSQLKWYNVSKFFTNLFFKILILTFNFMSWKHPNDANILENEFEQCWEGSFNKMKYMWKIFKEP